METLMKIENKWEGATNYRASKKRIDLILTKHKLLYFVLGKVKEPKNEVGKEIYKETNILAMNLIIDGVKDNIIPYISNIDITKGIYESLSKLFTIKILDM